jgi:hypothetical protein
MEIHKNKKMWLFILVILVVVGVGIYFFTLNDGSIPQPPLLP